MEDEKALKHARTVYDSLCERMTEHKWRYDKRDEEMVIWCGAQGDDLPIELRIEVDAKRQIVCLMSQMPFTVPQNRMKEMAVAVSLANDGMPDGNFDFDCVKGKIYYRITASFRESLIGKDLFTYLLKASCYIIDEYNDKFLFIAKNDMSVNEILNYIK